MILGRASPNESIDWCAVGVLYLAAASTGALRGPKEQRLSCLHGRGSDAPADVGKTATS